MIQKTQSSSVSQQTANLDSFIKNNRRFIKIKSGDTFRGIYRGFKVVNDMSFGEEKEIVVYQLQESGSERVLPWKNASTSVAEKMRQFSSGEEIIIKRTGAEAKDTKYEITVAQ